jgi:hypothetical protein
VSSDGRAARVRAYLFQPRTAKDRPGGMSGAMYIDQMVNEDGIWRFWNLSLNEPYFSSPSWKAGWAGARDRAAAPAAVTAPAAPRPAPDPNRAFGYFGADLVKKFAPDVPITALGKVQEHFRGGTGEQWDWPMILPMWWHYKNPVSGRTPELFIPECVPCDFAPDMSMTKHGYQLPPAGPIKSEE